MLRSDKKKGVLESTQVVDTNERTKRKRLTVALHLVEN